MPVAYKITGTTHTNAARMLTFNSDAAIAADTGTYAATFSAAGGSTRPLLAKTLDSDQVYYLENHNPNNWLPMLQQTNISQNNGLAYAYSIRHAFTLGY